MTDDEAAAVAASRDDAAGAAEAGDAPDGVAYEPPIEPGRPSLENVLFVLLGVLLALGVVARLVLLFG